MKIVKQLCVIAAAALCMVACNKETTAEMIEGSYRGTSSATHAYAQEPTVTENESLTITASDEEAKVEVVFAQWGVATFEGVQVEEDGSNAKLSGKGNILMPSMGGGDSKSYDAVLSGTVKTDKSEFALHIEVPAVMGGVKIDLTGKGGSSK
ncbi:MAG: hypothetical protein IJ684_04920 [Bacteroidales bacterium]|nr:hypothetical protein [Bacteroidales bacterium]